MGKKNVPKWKKRTPTNYPELKEEWKKLYHELHVVLGIRKTAALTLIGKQYGGLHYQSVQYHLFPDHQKYTKNLRCKTWSHEKEKPTLRNRIINYKKQYMHLRRHIDQYIEQAYKCTPLTGSMTLENLSRNIELESGISLAPKTILGLSKRYEANHSIPLIIENGHEPLEYSLNL